MDINIQPLYRRRETVFVPARVFVVLVLCALAVPSSSLGSFPSEPYEQKVLVTAYYSPLPGQCCYVRGGYLADKILNGEGVRGADGTPVKPGMIAAPPSYPFGTRVSLPGLGVFTVHDRGGAIKELPEGVHRLDIWVGHGEEGLARALAFGKVSMTAKIFPPESKAPVENFSFDVLPAPVERLKTYLVEGTDLLGLRARAGDRGFTVYLFQEALRRLGFFSRAPTGFFGAETQASLGEFLREFSIDGGSLEFTDSIATHLEAALQRFTAKKPINSFVGRGSSEKSISEAQRTLRFLGYYRGRTDGIYSDTLYSAILKYQQDHALVGTAADPGAGRIGPLTQEAIKRDWNRKLVTARAERLADVLRVERVAAERGRTIDEFLAEGSHGTQVRLLQKLLSDRGFFPQGEINGTYGPLTKKAVVHYQLERGIITTQNDRGAGIVGPETLGTLRAEEHRVLLGIVRAEGWRAL